MPEVEAELLGESTDAIDHPVVVEDDEGVDDEPMSYQEFVQVIREDVQAFAADLMKEYGVFDGRDMRSEISWLLEQIGDGIRRDLEKERRNSRQAVQSASRHR